MQQPSSVPFPLSPLLAGPPALRRASLNASGHTAVGGGGGDLPPLPPSHLVHPLSVLQARQLTLRETVVGDLELKSLEGLLCDRLGVDIVTTELPCV